MIGRVVLGGALVLAACTTLVSDPVLMETPPDRASFAGVGAYLGHRCGTLDCHGSTFRNLQLSGFEGNRASPSDVAGGAPTTPAELDASYRSVIALEPEILNAVVADRGAHPERLTLIRKARGTEHHKGQAIVVAGDDPDTCLTSWLAGAVDSAACARALKTF